MRNFIITIILTLFSVSASAQQMADSLRVYFRQGYSTFDPKYRDNQSQVDAFISRVKTFQSESDAFVILNVTYKAGASPEGTLEINRKISGKRSDNLTAYLRRHLTFADDVLHIEDVVEDWAGLGELVSHSGMKYRDEVLSLLSSERDTQTLKRELQQLHGGTAWRYMYTNMFPELRAFNVYIEVGVRNPDLAVPTIADTDIAVADDFRPLADSLSFGPMPMPETAPDWTRKLRIKTNAIGWAMVIANVAAEVDLAKHWSFTLPVYYSAWNYFKSTIKFRTFALQPEFRYWLSEENDRFFAGAHFGLAYYNFAFDGDYRYQDHNRETPSIGGGVSIGYRLPISKNNRWRVEFSLGAGVYSRHYDKFHNTPRTKDGLMIESIKKTYWGIDQVAVSFSYSFDLKKKGDKR